MYASQWAFDWFDKSRETWSARFELIVKWITLIKIVSLKSIKCSV
jgi:hypothetical protein